MNNFPKIWKFILKNLCQNGKGTMIFSLSINNHWMVLCYIRLFPFECLYIIIIGAWKGTPIGWNLKENIKEWTFKPRPTYYGINYHAQRKNTSNLHICNIKHLKPKHFHINYAYGYCLQNNCTCEKVSSNFK